ncbi:type I restriction enzyme S subunit [Xanthomonas arboricola]|uniref:restriction endonuclease subunit S n=1 Tax=Xanthomonas arboricola TaxID=56448 RepID=UPI001431E7A9|nr:restriction endonuclease subunit S [Xanthomonas arboricola]NJC29459.1 type I restriction enzyme S subunit [Xanthomonas arboricola]
MEVKPGYKKTEVGVIPDEWTVANLGRFAITVASGRSIAAKNWVGVYPIHGSTGVIAYTDNPDYEGDAILVARVGANAGKLSPVSGRYGVTDNTIILRFGDDCSLSFFLRQLEAKRLNTMVFGSGQPLITGTQLKDISLAIPPISEQCTIATALGEMDALLSGLDRLIAKKRAIKQAAMQQLLTGQTRLPGFSRKWEVKRLGDLGVFMKGSGIRKDEAQSGVLPCVRYGELYTHHHDLIRSFNSCISQEVAKSATRIRAGDLLFAGSGETKEEIGKCAAFIGTEEAYAGGDIVILRLSEADPMFMGYCCNTPILSSQKASLGQGDAVVHISAKALAGIEVYMPDVAEQTAIAEVLRDMDAEITVLETRRTKTGALKQAMMQELLTGRTRLV